MNSERKPPKIDDDELNASLQTSSCDELEYLSTRNQRMARIEEYEEAALARSDPFAAMIGFGNADLQRMADQLSQAVLDQFGASEKTVDDCREVEPTIRLIVKMREVMALDLAVADRVVEPSRTGSRKSSKPKGISLSAKPLNHEQWPNR